MAETPMGSRIRSVGAYVKNLLLYGGQTRAAFEALVPDIRRENLKSLKGYAVIVAVFIGIISLACAFSSCSFADGGAINDNLVVYVSFFALSVGFLAAVCTLCPTRPRLAVVLQYALIAALFAFALVLTVRHPTLPAVTAVTLMLVLPMLFVDRPVRLIAASAVLYLAFCVTVNVAKPALAVDDMWNGGAVTIVAFMFETIIDRVRIQNLALMHQVRFVSRHDLLTDVLNRNSFEHDLPGFADRARAGLAVVYVDVNGLHELNNAEGHGAGDAMLKCVAASLLERFGPNTYRLGGDEFASLVVDGDREALSRAVCAMEEGLAARGFSVSTGCAWAAAPIGDADRLVRDAEAQMRAAKRDHYGRQGFDRRVACRV